MAVFLIFLGLFLSTGGKRTDIMLTNYTISEDGSEITILVGVVSSMGYVRTLKVKPGGDNKYITFYSTFGLNNRIGSKKEFKINLGPDSEEIYFYKGDGGYDLVLRKNSENGEWQRVR